MHTNLFWTVLFFNIYIYLSLKLLFSIHWCECDPCSFLIEYIFGFLCDKQAKVSTQTQHIIINNQLQEKYRSKYRTLWNAKISYRITKGRRNFEQKSHRATYSNKDSNNVCINYLLFRIFDTDLQNEMHSQEYII